MAANDITKPVDLLTHAEGTGPLRSRRPVYVDFMPPCNSACPAGENIQAWMAHAQSGNYFEAFQSILEDCAFPAIMGRVCVKPCETGCNRNHIETTVNIHAVERYIGDEAISQKWPVRFEAVPTGKKYRWWELVRADFQLLITLPDWDILLKYMMQVNIPAV